MLWIIIYLVVTQMGLGLGFWALWRRQSLTEAQGLFLLDKTMLLEKQLSEGKPK